jgi:DNA-directed RNA polymerase specialized sigma24 family protein
MKDKQLPLGSEVEEIEDPALLPPVSLAKKATVEAVREPIAALTVDFRELVVLRELQGLSYKEITDVSGVPLGTVMSRLARGRHQLYLMLANRQQRDEL